MFRSLFRRLNSRFGPRIDPDARRAFLKSSLVTGASLLLCSCGYSRSATTTFSALPSFSAKRIVIIGGGFSGLACAHELKSAGYDVIVLEARNRLGGRVLSFNDFVPDRNVEGGAELIGSNHPTWVAYADRFDLEFLDVSESKDTTYCVEIDNTRLDNDAASKLWDDMGAAFSQLDPLAQEVDEDAPWDHYNAQALDNRSVQSWIDSLDVPELVKKACWINQTADNGVEPKNASLLGLLTAIKGGGCDRYWTETEVYRCKGGNSRLGLCLAEAIGHDRILTNCPVTRIEIRGENLAVHCANGRMIECDDVVLSVPPSVWSKIQFDPQLPPTLKPQMGVDIKYLAHVKSRFWENDKFSPDALANGPVQLTWHGTDGQAGDGPACMVCFSGGPAAAECLSWSKDQVDANFAKALSRLYPGFSAAFEKSRLMDWPRDPWLNGGYSFPAPGQVTTQGPILARGVMDISGQPRLHFAGEHTCYKFVGYMEGGLNSGARAAARIAQRDGVLGVVGRNSA